MSAPDKETRINQILRGCTKLHHDGYLPLKADETLDDYLSGLRKELCTWGIIELRTEAKSWREQYPNIQ